ncbi:MAG: YbgC/FadM family acyl-CoA thioesterase [Nitrospirae bacterium]|nr:YbgC/FadM family acyl-CoA thioesterase [Nitrospirota bacterium]
MKIHELDVKIYYEDTDCAGVVYYANYLKYFERARTEMFESTCKPLTKLMEEGIQFVVAEAALKYHRPGRYADRLTIQSWIQEFGHVTIVFGHRVLRKETSEVLVTGQVKIASVSDNLRPVRLPPEIKEAMSIFVNDEDKGLADTKRDN